MGTHAVRKKAIDEKGHRYGRLTVLKQTESIKYVGTFWLCKCDCGNEKVVAGKNLRSGGTKSCGCLRGHNRLPEGIAAFNGLIYSMKRNAKRHGHEWQLTKDQIRHLTKRPCYYCGAEPSQVFGGKKFNGNYTYNGLDRAVNTIGYTIDNVVPCCFTCNRAKSVMTLKEFELWAKRLYEHLTMRKTTSLQTSIELEHYVLAPVRH